MAAETTAIPTGSDSELEMVSIFLAGGNGLGASASQTLSAIVGNRAVNDGAAIDAFPGIEHEKEVREPL